MANSSSHGLLIIERILRDRDGVWRQINEERDLKSLILQMMGSSAASLAAFGIVLGASNSLWQALSSMVKLPLLFLVTLAICLPTLYLFNLVFGARLSMPQAVALIMVSVTVTSVLTLAFAPISLFFLITTQTYSFIKVLNVGILILTAIVGLRFLTVGMRAVNEHQERRDLIARVALAESLTPGGTQWTGDGPQPPGGQPVPAQAGAGANGTLAVAVAADPTTAVAPTQTATATMPEGRGSASMTLLYIWILLFGFVGTQLAWTLRPFFGSPGEHFAIFRHISGTFYSDIFHTIGRLLGGG